MPEVEGHVDVEAMIDEDEFGFAGREASNEDVPGAGVVGYVREVF